MIERKFINDKLKEFKVQKYIEKEFAKTGYSHTEIKRTPLGSKIIIYTTHPGLVVGRKGENIKNLTNALKKKFKMENPEIEIGEIQNPYLDVNLIADRIASTLERFGSQRFKSIGYKTLQSIMDAGALGAEIVIGGKVPSSRAKSWRFKTGYLKKSGYIAESKVQKAKISANLKSGTIGIKVSIMTPDVILPDKVTFKSPKVETTVQTPKVELQTPAEEVGKHEAKEEKITTAPAEKPKKRAPRKKKAETQPAIEVKEVKENVADKEERTEATQ